jgi:hypothetical protein
LNILFFYLPVNDVLTIIQSGLRNGIIRFIGLNKSQMSLNSIIRPRNKFGYWYHSINGISYGMVPSDPIKRRPLYPLIFTLEVQTLQQYLLIKKHTSENKQIYDDLQKCLFKLFCFNKRFSSFVWGLRTSVEKSCPNR